MFNTYYDLDILPGGEDIRKTAKLLYASTAKYGGDWNSMLHTHACTELFYVVGGLGQFHIGDSFQAVRAGDLVIINSGVEHTEVSLNSSPLEYIVLGVEGLEFFPGQDLDSRYTIINFQGDGEHVLYLLQALLGELEAKAPCYEMVCQDLLEILVVRLMRRTEFGMSLSPAGNRVNKECAMVRRYLDEHFKENINLDQLAAIAHINKYHMVHSFSREYGVSPINYLISRRIQESRHLLSETNHSLSQISSMLGFSSPSYFSQSFKRIQGVSPMEYRKGRYLSKEKQERGEA